MTEDTKGRDWTNLLWREKTWWERFQTVIAFSIASIFGVVALFGFLFLVGSAGDNIARYSEQHDRCLRNATNGYEIKQCR